MRVTVERKDWTREFESEKKRKEGREEKGERGGTVNEPGSPKCG